MPCSAHAISVAAQIFAERNWCAVPWHPWYAYGASPRQILQMVPGQGLTLTAASVGVGAVAALALGRQLASMLFSVPAYDPATFAAVCALLLAVLLLACGAQARRATGTTRSRRYGTSDG